MRHAPFAVDQAAHDAWLAHMRVAVDELGLSEEHEHTLWNYLTYAAASMINTAAQAVGPGDRAGRGPGEDRADGGPGDRADRGREDRVNRGRAIPRSKTGISGR